MKVQDHRCPRGRNHCLEQSAVRIANDRQRPLVLRMPERAMAAASSYSVQVVGVARAVMAKTVGLRNANYYPSCGDALATGRRSGPRIGANDCVLRKGSIKQWGHWKEFDSVDAIRRKITVFLRRECSPCWGELTPLPVPDQWGQIPRGWAVNIIRLQSSREILRMKD